MDQKKYGSKKILWHHDKMDAFRDNKITSPIYVRVKPTNRCNHHCYYCAYDSENPNIQKFGRKDEIPYSKLMKIIDDFRDMGVKAVTYSGGGEPLVYPNIEDILERTLRYKIDLSMITNGQKLNGRRAELLKSAKWIRVSLDSCNSKIFAETRRVPESFFYQLTNNLEEFTKSKPASCVLGINFVVQEKNFLEVYNSIKLFRNLGVENIKISPRHIPEGSEKDHEPLKEKVIEQINKAKEEIKGIEINDDYENGIKLSIANERRYSRCYIMQTIPAIGADQNVYFCHDKAWIGKENGVLGSIKKQSFKQLWFSRETAEKFVNFNPIQECKHHCTNDTKNLEIIDYLNCYGIHINFP